MWSTQLLLRASHLAWTISTRERSMRSWKYTLANIDSTRKSTQKLNRVNEWIRADHKKWVAKRRWKKAPWTMKEFNFYTTSIWRDYRIKRTILQNSDDPFFFFTWKTRPRRILLEWFSKSHLWRLQGGGEKGESKDDVIWHPILGHVNQRKSTLIWKI